MWGKTLILMDAQTTQRIVNAASAVASAAPVPGLQLGLFLLQEAIKQEPAIAAELQQLFSKGIPTDQDWQGLHDKVAAWSYRQFVPATSLPASETE